jgi:hypothetical protein
MVQFKSLTFVISLKSAKVQNKTLGQPKNLIQMSYGRYFPALKLIRLSALGWQIHLPYSNLNNYKKNKSAIAISEDKFGNIISFD